MTDLVVAGAGMGGLAAAAEARRRGARVRLCEKAPRPGGSMLLSSGVVWRHRRLEWFREECPGGDPALQRLVFERLDGDVEWLRSLGAPVLGAHTANPRTVGTRFDTPGLTAALVKAAGEPLLGHALAELPDGVPVVLATGGFPASRELLARHVTGEAEHLFIRAALGATGDGLALGRAAGAAASAGMDEVYGRNMPAPPARVREEEYVSHSQLYAQAARVTNERGERYEARTWSEIDVVQWTARQPRARAWFDVSERSFGDAVGNRTIGEMVAAATRAGAPVSRSGGRVRVETVAGVTSTLGGLAVDTSARAADGVFACGGDVGGIATGGYASGLAAALVLGRVAAAAALGED